jgi:hypothetical protein
MAEKLILKNLELHREVVSLSNHILSMEAADALSLVRAFQSCKDAHAKRAIANAAKAAEAARLADEAKKAATLKAAPVLPTK